MKTEKPDKIVGAWVIIEVERVKPHSARLINLCGPILKSNYLPLCNFELPVTAKPFEGIVSGDKVKVVCFTHKNELDSFREGKMAGFTDVGVRYFKETDGAWKLIYED